jgi:hypothetical protein
VSNEPNIIGAILAWMECIKARSHDFVDGVCTRCTATKNSKSILDLIAEQQQTKH